MGEKEKKKSTHQRDKNPVVDYDPMGEIVGAKNAYEECSKCVDILMKHTKSHLGSYLIAFDVYFQFKDITKAIQVLYDGLNLSKDDPNLDFLYRIALLVSEYGAPCMISNSL